MALYASLYISPMDFAAAKAMTPHPMPAGGSTLPEGLALARTGGLGHAEFLELVLADEVTRRDSTSADRRSRAAGLDPTMTLDRWDESANGVRR